MNIERNLLCIEWSLAGIEILSFISLYALLTQCALDLNLELFLVVPEKPVLESIKPCYWLCGHWLGMGGYFLPIPILNFRLGQYASAENDDLKKTYCFFVWNWHFNVIFRLSLGTYYVAVMKSFSGYSISNWKFKVLYI